MKHTITLIPGDGIGPEIVAATVRVIEANSGMLGLAPGGSAPDHNLSRARYFTVVNRNTSQWLWLLTWPTNAHDRELDNRSSVDLIFCGARANGNRLVARTGHGRFGCETENPSTSSPTVAPH